MCALSGAGLSLRSFRRAFLLYGIRICLSRTFLFFFSILLPPPQGFLQATLLYYQIHFPLSTPFSIFFYVVFYWPFAQVSCRYPAGSSEVIRRPSSQHPVQTLQDLPLRRHSAEFCQDMEFISSITLRRSAFYGLSAEFVHFLETRQANGARKDQPETTAPQPPSYIYKEKPAPRRRFLVYISRYLFRNNL